MVSVIYPWLRDRKREDPARYTYLDKSKGDANLKANPTGNKENSAKEGTDFLRGKGEEAAACSKGRGHSSTPGRSDR